MIQTSRRRTRYAEKTGSAQPNWTCGKWAAMHSRYLPGAAWIDGTSTCTRGGAPTGHSRRHTVYGVWSHPGSSPQWCGPGSMAGAQQDGSSSGKTVCLDARRKIASNIIAGARWWRHSDGADSTWTAVPMHWSTSSSSMPHPATKLRGCSYARALVWRRYTFRTAAGITAWECDHRKKVLVKLCAN